MKPLIQRSLGHAELVPAVRVLALITAAAIVVIFAVSAILIRTAFLHAATLEKAILHAETARSLSLRLQLNEETGIRGYGLTRNPAFLQPYVAGAHKWPLAIDELAAAMQELDPTSQHDAALERELNARWQATIARPILKSPTFAQSSAIELRGKALIDRFRAVDANVSGRLVTEESAAAHQLASTVMRITFWTLLLGLFVAAAIVTFLVFTVRALDDARVQREAFEEERRIANLLQEAFIQKSLPDFASVAFDAVYVPAARESAVGGDWYDAFELPDRRILFSIGDVCGHGLEAAIVMSRARQALLSIGMTNTDPATVLELVNRVLFMQGAPMVTAIVGYIQLGTMAISYASAGHPPPILSRPNGETSVLPALGAPLGAVEKPAFRTFHALGSEGALLLLYTDGVTEQRRDVSDGEARLLAAAAAVTRGESVTRPAQYIFDAMLEGESPNDDVAILAATFVRDRKGAAAGAPGPLERSAKQDPTNGMPTFSSMLPPLRLPSIIAASFDITLPSASRAREESHR